MGGAAAGERNGSALGAAAGSWLVPFWVGTSAAAEHGDSALGAAASGGELSSHPHAFAPGAALGAAALGSARGWLSAVCNTPRQITFASSSTHNSVYDKALAVDIGVASSGRKFPPGLCTVGLAGGPARLALRDIAPLLILQARASYMSLVLALGPNSVFGTKEIALQSMPLWLRAARQNKERRRTSKTRRRGCDSADRASTASLRGCRTGAHSKARCRHASVTTTRSTPRHFRGAPCHLRFACLCLHTPRRSTTRHALRWPTPGWPCKSCAPAACALFAIPFCTWPSN